MMTSVRVWYVPKFVVELSYLFCVKLEKTELQKTHFKKLSLSGTWPRLPEVSLSTSQTLSMPMCCVLFNPIAHANHCNKTITMLHLSLFLFVRICVCLCQSTPFFCTPILYTHLFLPTQIQKTWDSTVTKTPMISSYNMTNILKTLGKNQIVLIHSKLKNHFRFSHLLGFVSQCFSSCLIICSFGFVRVWCLLWTSVKTTPMENIFYRQEAMWNALKITRVCDTECGARNQSMNLLKESKRLVYIFEHKMKF